MCECARERGRERREAEGESERERDRESEREEVETGRGVWQASVRGEDRIHPEEARKSGRHGAQLLAQCVGQHILLDVQGAVLALVAPQERESSLLSTYWSGFTDVSGVPASRHGS